MVGFHIWLRSYILALHLRFPYTEHLFPTTGTNTLNSWSVVPQRDLLRILYLNLLSTLYTVSCRHEITPSRSRFPLLLAHERDHVNSTKVRGSHLLHHREAS